MNPTTVFAMAFIVTAFLLACSLIGGYNIREEQRDEIDHLRAAFYAEARDHERTRQAWHDERAGATPMRPLWQSPTVQRISGILAANEAQRFDPETADWSEPAEWAEGRRS